MTKTKINPYDIVEEVKNVIQNVEGWAVAHELNGVLDKWMPYLETTPVPAKIAKFLDNLIDLLNEVEGSEFNREILKLKFPKAVI